MKSTHVGSLKCTEAPQVTKHKKYPPTLELELFQRNVSRKCRSADRCWQEYEFNIKLWISLVSGFGHAYDRILLPDHTYKVL